MSFREEPLGRALAARRLRRADRRLKSKGVQVLVGYGLPAIRGVKGTADMMFLDALYRDAAARRHHLR